MNFIRRLLKRLQPAPPIAEMPPTPPAGWQRIHLFRGEFASEEAANRYCFLEPDGNHPQELTRDLPGAFIDVAWVEVHVGPAAQDVLRMLEKRAKREAKRSSTETGNTLVLIYEDAFGGFPYQLNDTPRLDYLGSWLIEVP